MIPVRGECVFKRRISKTISSKTIYGKQLFCSLSKDLILLLVHASLSSKAPSPFSQAIYPEKPKISQIVISTIYSIANHTKTTCVSCTSATILQAKGKKIKNKTTDPIYATRYPACEFHWCIWNTGSQLQAAPQRHKQMAWYYSPDLGLPSVNRVVNHCHKKIRDWKRKRVVLFLSKCAQYIYIATHCIDTSSRSSSCNVLAPQLASLQQSREAALDGSY